MNDKDRNKIIDKAINHIMKHSKYDWIINGYAIIAQMELLKTQKTVRSKEVVREPGFYWVKYDDKWEVGQYFNDGMEWMVTVDDEFRKDDFWQEIDERRIIRDEHIESSEYITAPYLMELFPVLTEDQASEFLLYLNYNTISRKECLGDGKELFNKWMDSLKHSD